MHGGEFPLLATYFPPRKLDIHGIHGCSLPVFFVFLSSSRLLYLALHSHVFQSSIFSTMADKKEAGILGESPVGKTTEYDDVVNDPGMDGLTLYEKKALLVNRELDSHGMGKYQWY